jgi:hypothetical protein
VEGDEVARQRKATTRQRMKRTNELCTRRVHASRACQCHFRVTEQGRSGRAWRGRVSPTSICMDAFLSIRRRRATDRHVQCNNNLAATPVVRRHRRGRRCHIVALWASGGRFDVQLREPAPRTTPSDLTQYPSVVRCLEHIHCSPRFHRQLILPHGGVWVEHFPSLAWRGRRTILRLPPRHERGLQRFGDSCAATTTTTSTTTTTTTTITITCAHCRFRTGLRCKDRWLWPRRRPYHVDVVGWNEPRVARGALHPPPANVRSTTAQPCEQPNPSRAKLRASRASKAQHHLFATLLQSADTHESIIAWASAAFATDTRVHARTTPSGHVRVHGRPPFCFGGKSLCKVCVVRSVCGRAWRGVGKTDHFFPSSATTMVTLSVTQWRRGEKRGGRRVRSELVQAVPCKSTHQTTEVQAKQTEVPAPRAQTVTC